MPPDAGDCEAVKETGSSNLVPVHQGRRILPGEPLPVQAWTENEEVRSGSENNTPGENRKLLTDSKTIPQNPKSRLQSGVTLEVWSTQRQSAKLTPKFQKAKSTTKFQKRKEKLLQFLKPPYFIITIIVVIVCIHFCGGTAARTALEWSPDAWWREPWRLFSYGCVHASDGHLVLNAIVALAVGWPLEREQGWWRTVVVWWCGVGGGALGAGVLQPHVHVVGASAAVYALLTAHLANVSLRYGHVPLWWFRPLSVVVLVVSEVTWTVLQAQEEETGGGGVGTARALHPPPAHNHVAWSAHLLGGIAGVLLGFIVFTGENISNKYNIALKYVSAIITCMGCVLAMVYYYMCWLEAD